MKITVNPHKCPQNHRCPIIRICPVNAISQDGYGLPVVDNDACIQCGKCFKYCPFRAFEASKE